MESVLEPNTMATHPNKSPARRNWLAVLAIGAASYLLVLFTMAATGNPLLFPTLLLIGALTIPGVVLAYVNWRNVPIVPGHLIGLVVAVGGVVGVVLASTLESIFVQPNSVSSMLTVGIIEETVKIIVPLLLLRNATVRHVNAGVVLGISAGAGFAVLETMGYGFVVLLQTGSLGAVDQTLLLRGVFAPACHIAWTGIAVAAIWRAAHSQHKGRWTLAAIGVWLGVVLLHALWDALSSSSLAHVIIGAISLTGLILAVNRSINSHGVSKPPPFAGAGQ